MAQHLEIKSSSRPNSPFTVHPAGGVVVQSNHPTHVVVLQPTQLTHGMQIAMSCIDEAYEGSTSRL